MTSGPSIDGVLVQWGERLFYPRTRMVKAAPPPHLAGGVLHLHAQHIRKRIEATVVRRAPQVMVKVTRGGRGMAAITAHFRHIAKSGRLPVEDDRGVVRKGKEALHDLAEQWRHGGSRIEEASPRREAFNIMLSMPAGTDPLIVQRAAREFAQHELGDHRWVMVLHDHQANPHGHLSVRAESRHAKRLNPRKADLHRWRETFADKLRGYASRPRPRGRPLAASSADLNHSGRSTREGTDACRHRGRKRSGAPARTQAAKTPPRHGFTSPPRSRSRTLSTTDGWPGRSSDTCCGCPWLPSDFPNASSRLVSSKTFREWNGSAPVHPRLEVDRRGSGSRLIPEAPRERPDQSTDRSKTECCLSRSECER